jgi:hypothetical protein
MPADPAPAFVLASVAFAEECWGNDALYARVVSRIRTGELEPGSSPMQRDAAAGGYVGGRSAIDKLLSSWGAAPDGLSTSTLASCLEAAWAMGKRVREKYPPPSAVWTGPEVSTSELRRTASVVSEIVAGAASEVLVVGYWLVASGTDMKELVGQLRAKANAGVQVRFIFDREAKAYGPDNFVALANLWPASPTSPQRGLFTWSPKITDDSAPPKLHAKVIIADRYDGLVTSANLTKAGFASNLEMGVRVQGRAAKAIVHHFERMMLAGQIVPVPET